MAHLVLGCKRSKFSGAAAENLTFFLQFSYRYSRYCFQKALKCVEVSAIKLSVADLEVGSFEVGPP